jgi:hypothetical protein
MKKQFINSIKKLLAGILLIILLFLLSKVNAYFDYREKVQKENTYREMLSNCQDNPIGYERCMTNASYLVYSN